VSSYNGQLVGFPVAIVLIIGSVICLPGLAPGAIPEQTATNHGVLYRT
jgi:hypothetical protein